MGRLKYNQSIFESAGAEPGKGRGGRKGFRPPCRVPHGFPRRDFRENSMKSEIIENRFENLRIIGNRLNLIVLIGNSSIFE
jgi:hypothetical protein